MINYKCDGCGKASLALKMISGEDKLLCPRCWEPKEEVMDKKKFKVGDRVVNAVYGAGFIHEIDGTDDSYLVVFDKSNDSLFSRHNLGYIDRFLWCWDENLELETKEKQCTCAKHKEETDTYEFMGLDVELPSKTETTPDYYSFTYGGMFLDLYRIADILGITCPVRFQAFKKLVRNGASHKSAVQDLTEARDAINRKLQMLEEEDIWNIF